MDMFIFLGGGGVGGCSQSSLNRVGEQTEGCYTALEREITDLLFGFLVGTFVLLWSHNQLKHLISTWGTGYRVSLAFCTHLLLWKCLCSQDRCMHTSFIHSSRHC